MSKGVAVASTAGLLEPLKQVIEKRFALVATANGQPDGADRSLEEQRDRAGGADDGQRGRTRRSADFEPLLARMREVLDYDPEAVW